MSIEQKGTIVSGEIRSSPRPHCALCNSGGHVLHSRLRDRLFEAAGEWTLKQCPEEKCGLVWLDPMPLSEDIGKAYAKYYTHVAQDSDANAGIAKRIYLKIKAGYLADKYGYTESGTRPIKAFGKLLYLFPLRRSAVDFSVRCLSALPQGRLLDVGCGAGEWLRLMRRLGWQVEGLDFDENAVRVARRKGLDVQVGSLEQQKYPAAAFDAVTLNHVIEHVPDPVATLKECARILKRGGKLVLATPNSASLSHRIFQNDWRGLEPPRHLHIFSPASMRRALQIAGFESIDIRPVIASSVVYESLMLRSGKVGPAAMELSNRKNRFLARLFNFCELCLVNFRPSVADCLAAVATKY